MTALIIPAYKPCRQMLELVGKVVESSEFQPIVVDDGSGEEFASIFEGLPEGVVLLRHPQNRGKGAALKTALEYILQNLPECDLAVTADADGQHSFEDIVRVTDAARRNPGALVLGSRAFRGKVPLRSRLGNDLTRQVFHVASGRRVQDTQTGLRAFDREAMAAFLKISGDRYEYEINVLLYAARSGMPIREVPIETIYIDDNSSSHFHPVRDSLRIYLCILQFAGSSLFCYVLDLVLLLLFDRIYGPHFAEKTALFLAVISARIPSAFVNFCLNRKFVFHGDEKFLRSLFRYAVLAVIILFLNFCLLDFFNLSMKMPLFFSKVLVEALLFVMSLFVQGKYVYRKGEKR